MLDWVINTPRSIALALEKKVKLNLRSYNRQVYIVLKTFSKALSRDVLSLSTKILPWEVDSGRPSDVKSGCPISMSPRHQMGTSPECSNRTIRGRFVDLGEGTPRDVLGTNIWRLGKERQRKEK